MNLQDFHSDKLVSEQLETEMSNVLTILGENVRRPGLQMFVDIIIIAIIVSPRRGVTDSDIPWGLRISRKQHIRPEVLYEGRRNDAGRERRRSRRHRGGVIGYKPNIDVRFR